MAIDSRNRVDVAELKRAGAVAGFATNAVATEATAGVVKQAATQADSVAADVPSLVTDFNALLAKLKAAGIMA